MTDLLTISNLNVEFEIKRKGSFPTKYDILRAVNDVSFSLKAGETLGVVGESGCGKSTLGRAILRLVPKASGTIVYQGREIGDLTERQVRPLRREMQIIFQDPLASLNPRMTIGDIIAEPLLTFEPNLSTAERKERVKQIMDKVGLRPEVINRYPHEFSGGQCQRIGIARAMILNPKLVICDEPVSALDVSIQAQIINLLMKLQKETGVSFLFISHDLSVVRHISHRIAVFYLGRLIELADRDDLYAHPKHPYTKALIAAIPIPDPVKEKNRDQKILPGDLPSPINPPSGCPFRTRCPKATDICAGEMPKFEATTTPNQWVACYHWRH